MKIIIDPERLLKSHSKFIVEKKLGDGIISGVMICITIWVLMSNVIIIYRLISIFLFLVITTPFNYKRIEIYDDRIVFSYPYLKQIKNILYEDIESIKFKELYYSRSGEFMDLEIYYFFNKRKKTLIMPLKKGNLTNNLWKHFNTTGIKLSSNHENFK